MRINRNKILPMQGKAPARTNMDEGQPDFGCFFASDAKLFICQNSGKSKETYTYNGII